MKSVNHSLFIIPLIGLIFTGCGKNNDDDQSDRIFDINDIELLEIENMTDFLGDASDIDTFYRETSSIYNDTSYVGGFRLSCVVGHYIEIYVFKYKDAALNDMNERINTVACIIQKGTSDKVPGDWWYTECIPNSVFVSKWNTIIQVSYDAGDFESV